MNVKQSATNESGSLNGVVIFAYTDINASRHYTGTFTVINSHNHLKCAHNLFDSSKKN